MPAFDDISKMNNREQLPRDSEERYRLIAGYIADILWQMDRNLHFVYVSRSAERVLGYSIEEALTERA